MLIADISHWNFPPNAPEAYIRQAITTAHGVGLSAVLWKCTEGVDVVDRTYLWGQKICRELGILFAGYHFGRGNAPVVEAKFFLSHANLAKKELAALDLEATMTIPMAEQWTQYVKAQRGVWPTLYSRKSYIVDMWGISPTTLSNCPGWFASYQSSPNWPTQWYTYCLWQYTNGVDGPLPHGLSGFTGNVDLNRFNPRFGDIKAWWGTDIATSPNPPIADKFIAPIGPDGLQSDGLWLKQPTNSLGQWFDANNFKNLYDLGATQSYHTGADLNQANDGDKGLSIRAVGNGVILFADRIVESSWGNLIIQESVLPDGSKVWFRYAHSDNLLVKAGDVVTIGQHLSDVSGAFGLLPNHLHYDVSPSGVLSRGWDGAVDWPGLRLSYLEANYVDPYIWLKSHMEIIPMPVTKVHFVALDKVPIFKTPAIVGEIVDTVAIGSAGNVDLDAGIVVGDRTFYKYGSGYVEKKCIDTTPPVPTPVTVTRWILNPNNPAFGANVRPTAVQDANGNPTGTPIVRTLDPGTSVQVILGTTAVHGVTMDQVISPVAGYVADWLLSATHPL